MSRICKKELYTTLHQIYSKYNYNVISNFTKRTRSENKQMRLGEGGDGEFFPQGVYFIRHTGLDPVSHTLETIINYSDCSGG